MRPPAWRRARRRLPGHRCAWRSGTPTNVAGCRCAPTCGGRAACAYGNRSAFGAWPGLLLLAFLAQDVFALIANALALIRLRRACGADLRRHLPHLLLVDARHGDDLLLGTADL